MEDGKKSTHAQLWRWNGARLRGSSLPVDGAPPHWIALLFLDVWINVNCETPCLAETVLFCVRYVILNIATVGPWTAQGWTAASSWTASCLFSSEVLMKEKNSFLYGLAGGSLDGTNDTPSITRSLIVVAMAKKRRPQYGGPHHYMYTSQPQQRPMWPQYCDDLLLPPSSSY